MVDNQVEAGRLLSKKTKKVFDEFEKRHKSKVAKALRKIGIKEKKNMKDRITRNSGRVRGQKLMGSKDARNIASAIKENLSMSGDAGDYGRLSVGVEQPVMGHGRRAQIDMASMLMEGKAQGSVPKLTARALEQGRKVIFFGNWDGGEKTLKFPTKPEDGVSPEIRGASKFGGAFYFIDKGMDNIERDIVREIPTVITKVFADIDVEKGK